MGLTWETGAATRGGRTVFPPGAFSGRAVAPGHVNLVAGDRPGRAEE
jgi:hypothetical protein